MISEQISDAIDQVIAGEVGRVCAPGKWRVWREDDGEVYIVSLSGLRS
jgi:hypothetical protein